MTLISACATGFVNALAHRERLGWVGASLLAILITGFVEKFYFALRHGLTTIYKSRKQRFFAGFCCKVIQITMILNAGILCAWVVGFALPEFLQTYNKWTIAPGLESLCHGVWRDGAIGGSLSKEELAIAGGAWNFPQVFNQHTCYLIGQGQFESNAGLRLRYPDLTGGRFFRSSPRA